MKHAETDSPPGIMCGPSHFPYNELPDSPASHGRRCYCTASSCSFFTSLSGGNRNDDESFSLAAAAADAPLCFLFEGRVWWRCSLSLCFTWLTQVKVRITEKWPLWAVGDLRVGKGGHHPHCWSPPRWLLGGLWSRSGSRPWLVLTRTPKWLRIITCFIERLYFNHWL